MSGRLQYGTGGVVGFVILTAVIIYSVTMLIWLAANGRSVLVVFPFCAAAWGCYLGGHYLVEGTFINKSNHEINDNRSGMPALSESISTLTDRLPSSPIRWMLGISGVVSMLLTFPTGIVAVGNNNFTLLLVSATLFVGGYIVGHQGITGKPL